jgi:hypothetical protein
MLNLFKVLGAAAVLTMAVADYRGWSLFSGQSASNAQRFSSGPGSTGSSSSGRSSGPVRHK